VRPIFYRTGRINPIPEHYREIAQVVRTGFHFFGIVPSTSIRKGDHLAIENGDSFTEIKIGSIQVHHVEFDIASQGDECGIKALGAVVKVKKGAKVYAVSPHEA
jgi:translation elongation factor EF-1alpha